MVKEKNVSSDNTRLNDTVNNSVLKQPGKDSGATEKTHRQKKDGRRKKLKANSLSKLGVFKDTKIDGTPRSSPPRRPAMIEQSPIVSNCKNPSPEKVDEKHQQQKKLPVDQRHPSAGTESQLNPVASGVSSPEDKTPDVVPEEPNTEAASPLQNGVSSLEALPFVMTVAEVAELFRVNRKTVLDWFASGELHGKRIGKRTIRFHRDDVIAFLRS